LQKRSKKLLVRWGGGVETAAPFFTEFLCSIASAYSSVPTCEQNAIARRCCQGWPVTRMRAFARSVLDNIEHGGRLLAGRGEEEAKSALTFPS
jgi:hypothetical protein